MKRVLISFTAAALLTCTQEAMAQDLAAGKKLFTDNCVWAGGSTNSSARATISSEAVYWVYSFNMCLWVRMAK